MANELSEVYTKALAAKEASKTLAALDSGVRNAALMEMAEALVANTSLILEANEKDMKRAKEDGMGESLQDRLLLDKARIADIAEALKTLSAQDDLIGEILEGHRLESGIKLEKVRVPIGVVAMIYEARPNVTADAAGLCLKTANACILRGGSAANATNITMTQVLSEAAQRAGVPKDAIQSIESTDRSATNELMELHGLIDVLIPRGGAALIKSCVENSKIPVIETGTGNCHTYIHQSADLEMARDILINAKCSRPGVCNACESLLVDYSIANEALGKILPELAKHKVKIHADEKAAEIATGLGIDIIPATQEDWGREYLDLEISIKCVSDVGEAISHINSFGTGHSESIVASDYFAIMRFTNEVDASAVYSNASTRFTDGGMFGYGAEIGISTQKLHARGPMGLSALTTSKFILMGEGQIR